MPNIQSSQNSSSPLVKGGLALLGTVLVAGLIYVYSNGYPNPGLIIAIALILLASFYTLFRIFSKSQPGGKQAAGHNIRIMLIGAGILLAVLGVLLAIQFVVGLSAL